VSPEQIALFGAAVFVATVSWRLPHALLWIAAGAGSFVVSTAYARYGLPHPAFATVMCDSVVCLLIYFFYKREWELRIGYLFQLSILLSLGHLTEVIQSHYAYVIGLEAINWLALLLILWIARAGRLKNEIRAGRYRWLYLRWSHHALQQERTTPPWTQVKD
jgi:hypothetical protein